MKSFALFLALVLVAPAQARLFGPRSYTAPGYRWDHPLVVVYFHGYGTTANESWHRYKLQEQFEMSTVPAMFLVPEVRSAPGPLTFHSLDSLAAPGDRVILAGHSAAGHQIAALLGDPRVVGVVLLDALYQRSDGAAFTKWLQDPSHHLYAVSRKPVSGWIPGAEFTMTNDSHQEIIAGEHWLPRGLFWLKHNGLNDNLGVGG